MQSEICPLYIKGRLGVILRLLLDSNVSCKWWGGAAVPHSDHRRLVRGLISTIAC